MKLKVVIAVFLLSLITSFRAYSDQIVLKNGDRITGQISEETDSAVTVSTEAMGTLSIKRGSIARIVNEEEKAVAKEEKAEPEIIQKGEVALGYTANRGNTDTERFYGRFFFNRNRKHVDEWIFKGDVHYVEADKKMNTQKWAASGRYAFSFGPRKAWYHFYRLETDHNRFANINYRLIPATGIGYWFLDLADTKLMAEGAIGLEYTDFRDDTKDSYTVVIVPRGYAERKFFERLTLSENILFYPAVKDFNNYRVRSETACTFDITKKFAFRVSYTNDYNSKPPDDTKKNDMSLISSLVYSF